MRPAAKNPHVSFEVEGKQQLIPPNGAASCTAGFAYESVIGQGIAELAPEEKKEDLLKKLLEHYRIPFQSFSQAHLERTAVYQIIVKQYTAKRRPIIKIKSNAAMPRTVHTVRGIACKR